ncbi:MAG TPA: selenocysteine-specific translation elongation factor [Acidimicrobiales bacterium]|nr:selenocysteine-specific translation elongation factor [Acidimicrobiales bacterium]
MTVVATAGHVDHGKSTLVRFLTGTDPDRLAEERERGMTIDLGFGSATLPSGSELGFVDVPGHERYVKNMLAGVTSVDACLFVVDATEGWRPQSEEHLRILELLGVRHGVVALTKVALVDRESAEIAALEVADHLDGTFLQAAEVVFVDAPSGVGVDELRAAIDRMIAALPDPLDHERPRLWIDRSFAIHGAGTVLTGTLTGGRISLDDELVVEPGHWAVRVRGLESHHGSLLNARPGRRLAVNIAGADHHLIHRGDALVRSRQWHLTSCFDASLRVIEGAEGSVGSRGAFRVHLGSGSVPVRLRPVGRRGSIEPGGEGLVRVWLQDRSLPLLPGDRYVLRETGRAMTVGGGEVLDVDPVLPASKAVPSLSVDRVVAERRWVEASELERLTGVRCQPSVGRWVMTPERHREIQSSLIEKATDSGREGVRLASLSEIERAVQAAGVDGLVADHDRVYLSDMVGSGLSDPAVEVLTLLEGDPWSPPEIPLTQRGALRELEKAGLAREAGGVWFAASAVDSAVETLAGLLEHEPAGFTVSAARQALDSTRKYVVPLLGYLDTTGVTRRVGDVRVAGPRMPSRMEAG